jgi:cytochrome c peroxidase
MRALKLSSRRVKYVAAAAIACVLAAHGLSVVARGMGKNAAGLDDLGPDAFILESLGLPAHLVPDFESTAFLPGDGLIGMTEDGRNVARGGTVMSSGGQLVNTLEGVKLVGKSHGLDLIPGVDFPFTADMLPPMVALSTVGIPPIPGLEQYIVNNEAAILLGKALFWDSQAGSDGAACATCHFHAGADDRMKNQISPGGDRLFGRTVTGAGGPNYTLKAADFPTYRLSNPNDRNSAIVFDSNDVIGSQGTMSGGFVALGTKGLEDCTPRALDAFNVHGIMARQVTGRNTPTVINAAYNYRNFWDGRANNVFNGVSPFGNRDEGARILRMLPDGSTMWGRAQLQNAALASQAVGPALSDVEMSCANKGFRNLGRKMLGLRPLANQSVHADDSVLGPYRAAGGKGLNPTYGELIRAAFDPAWWSATTGADGYTQMEVNFSLFWGLAIQAYEQTLISDQTPFDRFVGSGWFAADPNALNAQQIAGLKLFRGKALCISCHRGAEFTNAGTSLQPVTGETNVVEHMFTGDRQLGLYDSGFYNIGVRPTAEDRGVGGTDPWGKPLSFSRTWITSLQGQSVGDFLWIDPCLFTVKTSVRDCFLTPDPANTRIAVDGAFKTPTLRNVSLTQPYFHNGSRFTLEQVIEFYNRGGDRRGTELADSTGSTTPDSGKTNVHPAIKPLNLTAQEVADLTAFVRFGLTDSRVACESAPFDHPELRIPNGQSGSNLRLLPGARGLALDDWRTLPATGSNGRTLGTCMRNDNGSSVVGTEPAPKAAPAARPAAAVTTTNTTIAAR